jgi:hypothetical protein
MNVNLRVQFATYITLNVWQGIFNLITAPELSLSHANPSAIANNTINFISMDPAFYVLLSDIRIFELDSAKSWGQYFKYYHGVWPQPYVFDAPRQLYTAYNGNIYLDI